MDLSICFVTLNTLEYLEPLLASIERYTNGLQYEAIVVDNGSTDGTVEWVHFRLHRKQLVHIPTQNHRIRE